MRYKGLKGKAWEAVKAWCRAVSTDCFTCPATDLQSYNLQAGHYQPVSLVGSNNVLAWDERFIRSQCGHCNGAGQGRQVIFRERLVKQLGEDVVAAFDKDVAAKKVNPIKNWQAVIDRYEMLLLGL